MSSQPRTSPRRPIKILILALAAVVLLSGLVFVGHKVRRRMMVQSALVEGTAAYDRGDWDTARKMLGRYVAMHPEDQSVLEKYADWMSGKGENAFSSNRMLNRVLLEDKMEDPPFRERVTKRLESTMAKDDLDAFSEELDKICLEYNELGEKK